ncbi:MAG TPA: hypothetical protein VNL71_07345, partial [Chloroflexota bacterium]|nr:hypothetical protein [Chloroflexota bacterium]
MVPVTTRAESGLWNELVDRDHDLGRTQSAGAQCRYLAYAGDRVLAALGFGAAAWQLLDVAARATGSRALLNISFGERAMGTQTYQARKL